MPYAVVKVEASTGRVVAVVGRGLLFHHADRMASQIRHVEPGHYVKAVNETELNREESK